MSPLRILLCSENVPPQVNGIARRIGAYTSGLEQLGHIVDLLHPESGLAKTLPHVNPWNFTAKMMIVLPHHLLQLLSQEYDVVHAVLPLNFSGMWLLAAFKAKRVWKKQSRPALIVSWHCNLCDYVECHSPFLIRGFVSWLVFDSLCWVLPLISDRILTPTKATDPKVINLWAGDSCQRKRAGVCYTGIQKGEFSPDNTDTAWGKTWKSHKEEYLRDTNTEFLLLCVSRLSPEKGIDELIRCLALLVGCSLWLVGDGPARGELESLAEELNVPVKFWGYQKGEPLYAVYATADLFVCPSLTETFGQTVNEALASKVRVSLPRVPAFVEAYSDVVPNDAFWEPMDRSSMANAVRTQLDRIVNRDQVGVPELEKLKTWEEACELLIVEYKKAGLDQQGLTWLETLYLPVWWTMTLVSSIIIFVFSQIRSLFGGSVRTYISNKTDELELKVKMLHSKSVECLSNKTDELELKFKTLHSKSVECLSNKTDELELKLKTLHSKSVECLKGLG